MSGNETALVAAVMELVELRFGVATRVNSGMRFIEDAEGNRRAFRGAKAGTADIVALFHGRYLAIECKIGKNKPTPAQEAFLEGVVAAGGIALVARSVDFVDRILNTIPDSGAGILYDDK